MRPVTLEALVRAVPEGWGRTRRGSPMAGADGVSVDRFALRLDAELHALRRELLDGSYAPLPLFAFDVPKPSGGARRLAVPAVRDRVAQGAALAVLTPHVEAELSDRSFGYRAGRSVADAVTEIEALRDDGFTHVVDADVEAFFDSVDHDRLLDRLARLVPDARVLDLVRAWVAVDALYQGRLTPRPRGLPQGASLSPLLANLVLDDLDDALEAEGHRVVRYADDFVVLARSPDRAADALELTDEVLAGLRLRLHPEKTRLTTFDDGFRFLGTLFVRSLAMPSAHPLGLGTRTGPSAPVTVAGPDVLEASAVGRAFAAALEEAGLTPAELVDGLTSPTAPPAEPPPDPTPPPPPTAEPFDLAPGERPLLRTLYVHTQGAWLRVERGRFRVTQRGDPPETIAEVPVAEVDRILLFGSIHVTPAALRRCFRNQITVAWASRSGRPYGQTEAATPDHAARLQRQVLRGLDTDFGLRTAVAIVTGKLANTRAVLRRAAPDVPDAADALSEVDRLVRRLSKARDLDTLRGLEGQAAAAYFGAFGLLLRTDAFAFERRARRPPPDPVNALLSFGYTVLHQTVHAMIRLHRLSPYLGVLHAHRPGHPALASDLVEEWRFLVDRLVLRLLNAGSLAPDDFEPPDDRGVRLRAPARRQFLSALERDLHRRVAHPDASEPVAYRRCIELQVRRYVAALEGGPAYAPFLVS